MWQRRLLAKLFLVAVVILLSQNRVRAQLIFDAPLAELATDDPAPPFALKLTNHRVEYTGTLVETPKAVYRRKKSYKIFQVKLERRKTYQIYLHSKVFQGFLYLEDAEGDPLMENSSPTIGGESRIIYKAEKTGPYRIVTTSLGGFRTGAFEFSVRAVNPTLLDANLPKEAVWFAELDADGDGQIALYEWRKAGKDLNEFRQYDGNDDGFITAEELIRYVRNRKNMQ